MISVYMNIIRGAPVNKRTPCISPAPYIHKMNSISIPRYMTLYPYTAERRDVLDCTSPTTKRFPKAREMSRGRSPRAEGNLEVGGA